MKFRNLLILLCLICVPVLVACGGDDDNGDDTSVEDVQQDDAGNADDDAGNAGNDTGSDADISGTISGAVEKDFAFDAFFTCQDSGMASMGDIFELVVRNGGEHLDIRFPFNTEAGTFELIGAGDFVNTPTDELYRIDYRSEDNVRYDLGSGEMTIDEMPTAQGEVFSGSFNADLSTDDDETVSIDGTFNLVAGSMAFEGCE